MCIYYSLITYTHNLLLEAIPSQNHKFVDFLVFDTFLVLNIIYYIIIFITTGLNPCGLYSLMLCNIIVNVEYVKRFIKKINRIDHAKSIYVNEYNMYFIILRIVLIVV